MTRNLLMVLALGCLAAAHAAEPPVALDLAERPIVLRLEDGKLMGVVRGRIEEQLGALARYSSDNGDTWTDQQPLVAMPPNDRGYFGPEALLDRDGEVHVFFLGWAKAVDPLPEGLDDVPRGNMDGYRGNRLDIWYSRSSGGRQNWSEPRPIWLGYTGALNSVIQLRSGRILLPFSAHNEPKPWAAGAEGLAGFTHLGSFVSTVIYSDDGGATWQASPDLLRVTVPSLSPGYGAMEPVVIELQDGRVWMLIRTQMGRLYESFSDDGARWSAPEPTELISSDSPAGIVRLDDGRLVLLWNCCQRFPYAFGGRHVLHGAISDDDGRTWRGYREVGRDPKNSDPVPSGDFGTAYPFPAVVNGGKIIFCSGQGEGRMLMARLGPEWLLEREASADEAAWHSFGTRGVEFVEEGGARVLSIRRPDLQWPAAAVWNFPAGAGGRLSMRLTVREGCEGLRIGLTDHFSVPFDLEDHLYNVVNVEVDAQGRLLGETAVEPGVWHDLALDWSGETRACTVSLDGEIVASAPMLRPTSGICYLRLRATASGTDPAGFAVGAVHVGINQ